MFDRSRDFGASCMHGHELEIGGECGVHASTPMEDQESNWLSNPANFGEQNMGSVA